MTGCRPNNPTTEKPLVIKDGRFGMYVTDGETNATLRRGDTAEGMTLERGLELLAGRRAWEAENGPSPKKARKKAASKPKKGDTAPTLTRNVVKKPVPKRLRRKQQREKSRLKRPSSYFIPGDTTLILSSLAFLIIALS